MVSIVSFINSASSTSIPLEIAEGVHKTTPAEITVVSLYDESVSDLDPDVQDFCVDIVTLNADSRLDLGSYSKLRDILKDADILHTHHNSTGSLARLAAVGTGVKIINTEHNDHNHFSFLQNGVNCVTYPLVDAFIYNSESTRESIRFYEKLFTNAIHNVVYNGIDLDRIEKSTEPNLDIPSGPVISTVGVMTAQKDQKTLLRAMNHLADDLPGAELIVIGDGPKRTELAQLSKKLDIDDRVSFTGYIPTREEVYGILKKSDIFAIPSLYEGFCVAAVEAMGCGLPVVASDINVLREVIGDAGRFVPPQRPTLFAEELREILSDNASTDEIKNNARERAKEFNIEQTSQEYYNVYRSVL